MLLTTLHRLFQSFIFPPFNSMLIILLGLILINFRKKSGLTIICSGLIFLYIQSIPLTAYVLSQISQFPPLTKSQLEFSQAIVVLGGGINTNSPEYPQNVSVQTSTAVRLTYTAYLAKQYPTKIVVTSGGSSSKVSEATVMRNILYNIYGLKNEILTEDKSRSTKENAKFVARMLLPQHIKYVVIVTQAFHMQRAMMLFRKYGLNPSAAPTDNYFNIRAMNPVLIMIPNPFAMSQTTLVLHELLGDLLD